MKKIIIYSTRICPYCVRAKNFFSKRNIEFTFVGKAWESVGQILNSNFGKNDKD